MRCYFVCLSFEKLMKNFTLACVGLLLYTSCTKTLDSLAKEEPFIKTSSAQPVFKKYTINAGEHISSEIAYKPLELSAMNFVVRFDSSAIYQSKNTDNQEDINKLYGFADNGANHHQFSARIGWCWTRGSLRLYAYVYNNGTREAKEITIVAVGQEVVCSIKPTATHYIFSVGDKKEQLPRMSTTPLAKGYQLYPYFGGDETAPHEVRIWIKDL